MTRIVLDPEEVNQAERITLTDGRTVRLSEAEGPLLDRIWRQLQVHRSSYAHALDQSNAAVAAALEEGEEDLERIAPLYVRVAALRAARDRGPRRPADELDLRLLLQAESWTSSSGVTRDLEEMTPSHRRNLAGWLERNSDVLEERLEEAGLDAGAVEPADPWVAGTPLYRRLHELIEAESARERAIDEARQVVRAVEFERSGEWPEA